MAFNAKEHMITLKGGKEYLEVKWRLVWFREEHPDWQIETDILSSDDNSALFRARIYNKDGFLLASGHGSESVKDFGDFLEKAETKAIGRALAMLGYGTQFAPELDEGERIVDAPVAPKPKPTPKAAPTEYPPEVITKTPESPKPVPPACLDKVIEGGPLNGMTYKQVYKDHKVPDLIEYANQNKFYDIISNIRLINAYIEATKK